MLLGSKHKEQGAEGLALRGKRVSGEAADRAWTQREAWRRAAQTVTRTWSEWTATDRRKRSDLYRRYTAALDEEEVAAARLARLLTDDTYSNPPCHCLGPAAHDGETERATDAIARWEH